jgi:hypothetical protein
MQPSPRCPPRVSLECHAESNPRREFGRGRSNSVPEIDQNKTCVYLVLPPDCEIAPCLASTPLGHLAQGISMWWSVHSQTSILLLFAPIKAMMIQDCFLSSFSDEPLLFLKAINACGFLLSGMHKSPPDFLFSCIHDFSSCHLGRIPSLLHVQRPWRQRWARGARI